MIRSKPATDEYREAWERVFGSVDDAIPDEKRKPHRDLVKQAFAEARAKLSHESDCPSRIGDPCRCPVGDP